ncbi:MAG: glycosyltransferase [Lachnospiraceae bacterium]|nr:glycosyltransferase [Lachnospiraceae bacterium]
MKRVLLVINTLGTAGAEKALVELINRFDKNEYEIDLEVILNQGELIAKIPTWVNVINTKFDSTEIAGKKGRLHLCKNTIVTLFRRAAVIRTLPYLIKESINMLRKGTFRKERILWQTLAMGAKRSKKEYDLAIAFTEGAATYYVSRYVKALKKASFVHIAYADAGYSRSLDNDCYKNIDKIFCVSREVLSHFLDVYPEFETKTEIFHNIVDVGTINRLSKSGVGFDDEFDGTRILTVGRLTKQKTIEKAIESLALLKEQNINVRWYVIGDGEQRQTLKNEICRRNLSKDFILLGFKENPYPYLEMCDIYVNVSEYEGKSIAIQEAQAFGKAVVATNCKGNLEQIRGGEDGILCDYDAQSIANSVRWLIDNPEEKVKMGKKAQDKIYRYCSNSDEFERILSLFEDEYDLPGEQPLISVLVPFYNAEKYLKRCVDSIIGQSYKNLDIVLLNNASNDGSEEIAKSLMEKDQRITLHYLQKPGLAGARNELLRLANGEYIIFVDSDDELERDAIVRLLKNAIKVGADLTCGSHIYRTETSDKRRIMPQKVITTKVDIHKYFLTEGRDFNHAWGKLYKRDLFEGLSYPEGKYYEDIYMLPKVLDRCMKIVTLSEPVYIYYKNEQSISFDENAGTHMDGLEARMGNLEFYKANYPELENEAGSAANDFALFLLGKIQTCGKKANVQSVEKVNDILKKLPLPRGKEYKLIALARKLYVFCPSLTMFLLSKYSIIKNR